ncbi:MAG: DPP IV N-terminal domain-containing protein [Cyclobacteriaceae bacterium]
MPMLRICLFLLISLSILPAKSQPINWSADGNGYYAIEENAIVLYSLPGQERSVLVSGDDLRPSMGSESLPVKSFSISQDGTKFLIYTNSIKVWRQETRGDYWVFDLTAKKLRKIGKDFPESSLMFAKFSPDGQKVAYVSGNNLYVEETGTGVVKAITTDGTRKLINGTFDWAYEEEFGCRDGFRWSPDGSSIAFWQVDAREIPDYYMINNADSVYSQLNPVEYPTAGQDPSPARIGVADINSNKITWIRLPGDPQQHYIPVMSWVDDSKVIIQQLNRKQNESKLFTASIKDGSSNVIYKEQDAAWIDIYSQEFNFLNKQKDFAWLSEKDGWRHLYKIGMDGKETLMTSAPFDVLSIEQIDLNTNTAYFMASPENATQRYLYKVKLDGKSKTSQVSPKNQPGTHAYVISPNGKYAEHTFSNTHTRRLKELISLPSHDPLDEDFSINTKMEEAQIDLKVEFFKVTTSDNVEMDGWMVKPKNFDPAQKYPVVFYVYSEPASATVRDVYGTGQNRLYRGNMAEDGYIYMSLDNRGTPSPKGREWRKSIYRKIGRVNIDDQAAAVKEILKWDFVDPDRIAVWGWSGGGSATLNLLFRYPKIYHTGISIAAVANQLTYDNIYQERYMGLPQENREDFVNGSPIVHAKNLEGNLLYIHGTGDDNVHYNNAEMLIDELVKYNKQFQFMAYPNRTHSISEGEGTFDHMSTLFTNYLRQHCPPGGKNVIRKK